jgi:hypothetical protein
MKVLCSVLHNYSLAYSGTICQAKSSGGLRTPPPQQTDAQDAELSPAVLGQARRRVGSACGPRIVLRPQPSEGFVLPYFSFSQHVPECALEFRVAEHEAARRQACRLDARARQQQRVCHFPEGQPRCPRRHRKEGRPAQHSP